jgi:hypothetical protein
MTKRISEHGYGPYTNGCRCAVCKDAKADYMRERRREGRRQASAEPVPGVKHGTLFAYDERGCRCGECLDRKRTVWRDEKRRCRARDKAAEAVAA